MSKVFNMVGGGGGPSASIFVTGLSETDTVTAVHKKIVQVPNPDYVVPTGYTQLEYIESTGTQYIQTGISAPNGFRISCEIMNNLGAYSTICSARPTNANVDNNGLYWEGSSQIGVGAGGWATGGSRVTNKKYQVDASTIVGNLFFKLDDVSQSFSFNPSYPQTNQRSGNLLTLFATINMEGEVKGFSQDTLYAAKIYTSIDDSELVGDFIPCKRTSDNAIGLYDLVSNSFFENAGTGTFIAGSVIPAYIEMTVDDKTLTGKWTQGPNPAAHGLPDGYTELEYIKSTGTQYIVSNIYGQPNLKIRAKVKYSSFSGSNRNAFIGYYTDTTSESEWWEIGYTNGNSGASYAHGFRSSTGNENKGSCGGTISTDVIYDYVAEFKAGDNKLYVDDSLVATTTNNSALTTYPLNIFTWKDNEGDGYGKTIYELSAELNGDVISKYVPCRRDSDNAVGMFEIVSQSFHENAGTGEFIAGAEIPQTIDGFLIKPIRELGTWTVTATNGTKTATQDVLVDVITEYEIEMSYKLWLYRDGAECEDVTGGWEGETAEWSSEVKGQFSVYKRDTYLECYGTNGAGSCFFTTANPIDVTNYSQLHFVSKRSNSSGGSKMQTSTTKPYYSTGNYLPKVTDVLSADFPSTEKAEAVLDISTITGDVYILMLVSGYTSYLYEVWLE